MVIEAKIMDYKDLVVWQKAYQLSLEIHKHTLDYPRYEQFELASQMRRASKGICANLAEGFGKQSVSKAEFKRFILMAMGSADEMRVWLSYSKDLGYLNEAACEKLEIAYRDIARMLNGLHKSWS